MEEEFFKKKTIRYSFSLYFKNDFAKFFSEKFSERWDKKNWFLVLVHTTVWEPSGLV